MDLLSETFARALENRLQFNGYKASSKRAWLYEIARNLLIDSARKGQVELESAQRIGINAQR